jgi:hypothetical protein
MPIASLPLRLLMRAVGIAPANVAEATGTSAIGEDLVAQQTAPYEIPKQSGEGCSLGKGI